jgi:hypothetical protein
VAILFKPEKYSPAMRAAIESMPALSVEIVNRWMREWPVRTSALIASGEYLAALAQETVWAQEACGMGPPANGMVVNPLSMMHPPPAPKRA